MILCRLKNHVTIKKDGEIQLVNKTGWGFYLNEGTYDLDSCYQIKRIQYLEYDSVKVIVDSIFPNGVHGKMKRYCTPTGNNQNDNYEAGNIAVLNTIRTDLIKANSDTITIYWRDPQKNAGRYIIEFQNIYDGIIGYRISDVTQLFVNITDFPDIKDSSLLLVTIYSEYGRKSSRVAILAK